MAASWLAADLKRLERATSSQDYCIGVTTKAYAISAGSCKWAELDVFANATWT